MITMTAPTWFVEKVKTYNQGQRLVGPYESAVPDAFKMVYDELGLPYVKSMHRRSGLPPSAALVGGVLSDGSIQILGAGIDLVEQLRNPVMTAPFIAIAHARTNDTGLYCLGGQQSPFGTYVLVTLGVPNVGAVLSAWANGISTVLVGASGKNPVDNLQLSDFNARVHQMRVGQGYARRLNAQIDHRWTHGKRDQHFRIPTSPWLTVSGPTWMDGVEKNLVGRLLKGPHHYVIKQAIKIAADDIAARNVDERTGAPFAALVLGQRSDGSCVIVSAAASCIRLTRNASYHAEFMAIWEAARKSKGKHGLDAIADGFVRYILVSTAAPCNSCAIAASANGITDVYAGVRQSMVTTRLGFHEAPLNREAFRRLGMRIVEGICQRECAKAFKKFSDSRRADSMTMPLMQKPDRSRRRGKLQ